MEAGGRASSILWLQTPRSALWRCHRSSPPGLSPLARGTRGGSSSPGLSLSGLAFLPPLAPPARPSSVPHYSPPPPRSFTRLRSAVPVFLPASVCLRLAGATQPALSAVEGVALTPAGRLAAFCPGRPPVFTAPSLPCLPPPTTPSVPVGLGVGLPHRSIPSRGSRLRLSFAGSSSWQCRIVFTFVAVVMVPSVASHPASRRRGDFRFSPAQRQPVAEVSHLGRACSFTAHERWFPTAADRRPRSANFPQAAESWPRRGRGSVGGWKAHIP